VPQQAALTRRSHGKTMPSPSSIPHGRHAGSGAKSAVFTCGRASTIRVLVVDDHPVARIGLAGCLAGHEHLLVVGEAGDGEEALAKAKVLSPDVVLMDIEMPKLDGLAATEVLRREHPQIKVLIISMQKHSQSVLRMIQAGAHGYVSKGASLAELVQAIETVAAGGSFFGTEVAEMALNQFVKRTGDRRGRKQLSPREREVLVGIADGLSNKEIAARLGLGVRTIESHREGIMRKLNIRSVAGLTKFAIAEELISLP
jgi:two-component system, NarL family, nitrate/nitrite response regulator NarL